MVATEHGVSEQPGRTFVQVDNLTKRFGTAAAVSDLSLTIAQGESITLLGPSGCGKTTTLRMIAGLETGDAGAIQINGVPVFDAQRGVNLPPERRNIGMVFQSYAIWPHMTVAENVGFPLRVRRLSAAETAPRVRKALDTVGLAGFEDRPATRLSGGQQQRVALARALIHEPAVLLLDEPLSNLDVKLREQMRLELKILQQRLNLTFVNVTHDQVEALSISDRIAILDNGRIEQVGTPRELYENPNTPFVRDFLGKSAILPGKVRNIFQGRVGVELACQPGKVLECSFATHMSFEVGQDVDISVRPEAIRVKRPSEPGQVLKGTIITALYQGERSECVVNIGGDAIVIYLSPDIEVKPGRDIELSITTDALKVWPK